MSMIKIEDLTFGYPASAENVFEDLNAVIDTDWKLALTGRNGRGKTTLLKLLSGEYEYKGKIKGGVRCDYFPYTVKDIDATVSEAVFGICPSAEEWEIAREFSCLGLDRSAWYMPFGRLSDGEKTKVLLAAMFLNDGRFMLIDEPTNHLDAKARAQVAAYLNKKRGFVLVSHDRAFADACVDHVMALNRTGVEIRSGNLTAWLNDFEDRQNAEQKQNEKLQTEIKRLRQSAVRSAEWARRTEAEKTGCGPVDRGYIGHKAAKMMKHAKVIEDRQRRLIGEKESLLRDTEIADRLKMNALQYRSDVLADLSYVQIVYDGVAVNKPVSFTVTKGKRIALNGCNGCGKSSIVKALLGRKTEYTGRISVGSGLTISYVPQDASAFSGNIREKLKDDGVEESLFMATLFKMGVEENPLGKDIRELSDGQRKKVLLAESMCQRAHLYIWDEPLNYIDIYTRVQIECLIKEFCPTMVFIEHDSAFRDSVATEVIDM